MTFFGSAKAQELTVLVSNWAPYNFVKNDKIVGISTDLVKAALERANVKSQFLVYPFKRALYTVKQDPNVMMITVARVPERENMFRWIGPLHPRTVYLYKLKSRTDIQINSVEDIQKYKTSVLLGGSVEQFFKTQGFSEQADYFMTSTSTQLLKILFKGRADLIPGDPLDLAFQLRNMKHDFSELEHAYQLSDEGGYYMIANKNVSNELVYRIQAALDQLLAEGINYRIIDKYIQ